MDRQTRGMSPSAKKNHEVWQKLRDLSKEPTTWVSDSFETSINLYHIKRCLLLPEYSSLHINVVRPQNLTDWRINGQMEIQRNKF